MATGRPTKFKKEMCDQLIELMSEGASKTEVCAELDITTETLYQWVNPDGDYYNKAFSDALKIGMIKCQAWWEKKGRTLSKDLNAAVWIFNMKNRFREDWQDMKHVEKRNLSHEEWMEKLDELDAGAPEKTKG